MEIILNLSPGDVRALKAVYKDKVKSGEIPKYPSFKAWLEDSLMEKVDNHDL